MQWFEKCIMELTHHNVFSTTEQRIRFRDLVSCYCNAPFFSKALTKCMFLASRDDEHFIEMLDELNAMIIDNEKTLRLLSDSCEVNAQNRTAGSDELYALAVAFMNDTGYKVPDYSMLDADTSLFIRQALRASLIIDELPDPRS